MAKICTEWKPDATFTYEQCDYKTLHRPNLLRDVKSVPNKTKDLACHKCDFKAAYTISLRGHTKDVHEKVKGFACLSTAITERDELESTEPRIGCSREGI